MFIEVFCSKCFNVFSGEVVEAAKVNFLWDEFEGVRVAAIIRSSQDWLWCWLVRLKVKSVILICEEGSRILTGVWVSGTMSISVMAKSSSARPISKSISISISVAIMIEDEASK